MTVFQILVLGLVQGIAELLPVSSSAHVIAAEKLMGLDPAAPQMTFLLVMLHTGTMFAVIGYFWSAWYARYFASREAFLSNARLVVVATAMTGVVGILLLLLIERVVLRGSPKAEVEQLFGNVYVMATGLAAAGVMIIVSGLKSKQQGSGPLGWRQSAWIGAVQGMCLPFRGFSRSGATISTGLLLGIERLRAEEFSFALAVVLTPAVIAREGYRLFKTAGSSTEVMALLWPSLLGMACSFVAGWLALRWLSTWLERGRWHWFGYYCLFAAVAILALGR
ncbi:MAG: undecaprenyl-diphosphate phosphatase [Caldimonas sp.]